MKVSKVSVLGAGQMGSGIAQVIATAGVTVTMIDVDQKIVTHAQEAIKSSLAKFVGKGSMTDGESLDILSRIRGSTDIKDAADAHVIIEAVNEDLDLKKSLLRKLDSICPQETIFMSNTSQFSITLLASATNRSDRFIGTHWFNPPVLMRLVEVVKGLDTSDETANFTLEFCKRLGKETVLCRKDLKGFITTRFIWAMRMECFRMLEEGLASIEEIDKALKLAFNHPMGPFELMDFGHLDLSLQVVQSLHETYGDRFLPPQSLINLVDAGYLGRRSGRGWYRYDKNG